MTTPALAGPDVGPDVGPEQGAHLLDLHLQHCRSWAWTQLLAAAQRLPGGDVRDDAWLAAIDQAADWYVAWLHPTALQPARLQGRAVQLVAAMRGPA